MANEAELREYLRRATRQLRQTRQQLAEERARAHEPIAIVGMACRFPGGIENADDYWTALLEGRDLITTFPGDRGWDIEALYDPDPDAFAKSYVREGGFLTDPAAFDAGFFGIGPLEAEAMDPQQRLLLEVAWEAVEHARVDPATLRGSVTGVYLGLSDQGYGFGATQAWDGAETYYFTGNAAAMAAGRVSYVLGLEGPAVTLDTACSSSLVAVHHAARALRGGECDMALAGGVAVMATPGPFALFSRQRALAPDGRCKSYSSNADGTAWGEGAGILVLERLSDARRLAHPVLAVVRGSAVNADGASNGITAPRGLAQRRVIESALADAGVEPAEVDVVEGHGTGTVLGDPVEVRALQETYGRARCGAPPLLLGSVKSNMGHTQSAAGVAGLIKMVQTLRHGVVPPTLHVDTPTPHADWSAETMCLTTRAQPLSDGERPHRGAVSSFGISGTNAHVIVEEAGPGSELAVTGPVSGGGEFGAVPWVLSAKTSDALCGQAARLLARCTADPKGDPVDIGHALATTRTTFEHRAVVLGASPDRLLDGLAALRDGRHSATVVRAVGAIRGRVALLIPGQGTQRAGMGRQLYRRYGVFAETFDRVCDAFAAHLEHPLRAVVFDDAEGLLARTEYTQPAVFAVTVSLFRTLEAWGLRTDFVIGHSIGELAAAHVCGALDLPDAVSLVAARARAMRDMPPGAMISVRGTVAEVRASLSGYAAVAAVAADNAPNATVVSGDPAAIDAIAGYWRRQGRRVRPLAVDRAFHSPQVEAILPDLSRAAAAVRPREPRIPLVSTVTGDIAAPGLLTATGYWPRHAREPVEFQRAVRTAYAAGVRTFLEIGYGDTLCALVRETLADADVSALPLLRPGAEETACALHGLAGAWVHGAEVTWAKVFDGVPVRPADLPTYAFQRRDYWVRTDATVLERLLGAAGSALAGPGPGQAAQVAAPHATRDSVEVGEREEFALRLVLARIREILIDIREEDIALDATILEIGLTSLSALELRSRINAAAGTSITVEDLFTHPTPRALATLLVGEMWGATADSAAVLT
ncbi:type I polyketide synthase [Nocardia sp. NPDC127579]|uniref:type I polyketide synthase n=1 Tax=Nocardia sp. NPDC127579 TaxID=3345402 RepID=UPI00362D0FE1